MWCHLDNAKILTALSIPYRDTFGGDKSSVKKKLGKQGSGSIDCSYYYLLLTSHMCTREIGMKLWVNRPSCSVLFLH